MEAKPCGIWRNVHDWLMSVGIGNLTCVLVKLVTRFKFLKGEEVPQLEPQVKTLLCVHNEVGQRKFPGFD